MMRRRLVLFALVALGAFVWLGSLALHLGTTTAGADAAAAALPQRPLATPEGGAPEGGAGGDAPAVRSVLAGGPFWRACARARAEARARAQTHACFPRRRCAEKAGRSAAAARWSGGREPVGGREALARPLSAAGAGAIAAAAGITVAAAGG